MAAPVYVMPVCKSWLSMSYDAEDHGKVLLIGHLNPAILVSVVATKHISQPLRRREKIIEVFVLGEASDCYILPLPPGLYDPFLFIPPCSHFTVFIYKAVLQLTAIIIQYLRLPSI